VAFVKGLLILEILDLVTSRILLSCLLLMIYNWLCLWLFTYFWSLGLIMYLLRVAKYVLGMPFLNVDFS
jgi:hypothetical protein